MASKKPYYVLLEGLAEHFQLLANAARDPGTGTGFRFLTYVNNLDLAENMRTDDSRSEPSSVELPTISVQYPLDQRRVSDLARFREPPREDCSEIAERVLR